LGIHLKKIHNLSSKEYIKNYDGHILSINSNEKYKLNDNSKVLANYIENNKKEFSLKVSEGILNSTESRKKHSDMMIELNNKQQSDPDFKKIVSETAKKTSVRPEIQEQRSVNLKKWRDENPEDFHNKCIKKMIGSFQSKPEKKLFEFVSILDGFSFKKNQFINSLLISNKSHNKQIDMGDKEKRIYIEFDGILHFEPRRGIDVLENIQQKDSEIDQHMINHNWTLIRISYDQFKYSTKMINKIKQDNSYFKQECLDKLVEILNNNKPGIYKIGNKYV
jgi:very-short-patch-repair endonuclease